MKEGRTCSVQLDLAAWVIIKIAQHAPLITIAAFKLIANFKASSDGSVDFRLLKKTFCSLLLQAHLDELGDQLL